MKFLMLIVDGFEDTEALATLDVLQRGKQEVVCASITGKKEIVTKCGCKLTFDTLIEDVKDDDFDGIIIPGGPGSFKIMPTLPIVEEMIRKYADSGKLVAAICAAPHLVGKLGYFKDRNYTVHPGFEGPIIGGNYQIDKGVVVDGNFITAKSMYYSIEFGLTIIEYFYGTEYKEEVRKGCQGGR